MKKPTKKKPTPPAKKYKCPECGGATDGHRRHKSPGGRACDLVLGRRGWRQLGVYDG